MFKKYERRPIHGLQSAKRVNLSTLFQYSEIRSYIVYFLAKITYVCKIKKKSYEFVLVDILAPQEKVNLDKLTSVHCCS